MARFEEVLANRGVDNPRMNQDPWMMVPLGGSNVVCLLEGVGYSLKEISGKPLTIKEVPAQGFAGAIISRVKPGARFFSISSHIGGAAVIQATKGRLSTTLKVSVHPRRSFKVAFFFLQSRTSSTPDDANGWINDLNDVFGPQANIWFEKGKAEVIPSSGLSAILTVADLPKLEAVKKASGADINIFLAGPKIGTIKGEGPNGFYHIETKMIVIADQPVSDPWATGQADPVLATIAHEIGHFMNRLRGHGQGHDYYLSNGYISDILNTINGRDIKISQQRVIDWNAW